MICLICRQADVVDGVTTIRFERGEMKLVVNNVPARICSSCGEEYVDEEVAAQLLLDAEEVSMSGVLDSIVEYARIA